MLILVSYDVPDDRRRTKAGSQPQGFRRAGAILGIEGLVDTAEDSVRIYRFCADCGAKLEIVGVGVVTEDPKMYIV